MRELTRGTLVASLKTKMEANYILMTACILQTGASCMTCIYADSGRSPGRMTSVKLGERMEAIVRKNHGCCLSWWSFINLCVTWCHWLVCRQHKLLIVSAPLIGCLNSAIIVSYTFKIPHKLESSVIRTKTDMAQQFSSQHNNNNNKVLWKVYEIMKEPHIHPLWLL